MAGASKRQKFRIRWYGEADGSIAKPILEVKRKRGIKRWQKVVTVYEGTLPRNPSVTHAWTQLRIGSQAIRGLSAVNSSEWSCSA